MSDRDTDLDNAVALARAIELDRDAFAEMLTAMDCAEHHRAILCLVWLLRDVMGSADAVADYAEALQVGGMRGTS